MEKGSKRKQGPDSDDSEEEDEDEEDWSESLASLKLDEDNSFISSSATAGDVVRLPKVSSKEESSRRSRRMKRKPRSR